MLSHFMKKVCESYQLVTALKEFERVMLAWEFDPALFQKVFQPALSAFRKADIPYDLLQSRPNQSAWRMQEQGFNLAPHAQGNDWSHVTIGMFSKLKAEEWPSIYEMAKQKVPTYQVMRAKIMSGATTGLSYLVIALDYPRPDKELKEFFMSRYDDFSTYDLRMKTAVQPHVSILGFSKKDETRVAALIPQIQEHVIGAKMRPSYLQLWENFAVVKHAKV